MASVSVDTLDNPQLQLLCIALPVVFTRYDAIRLLIAVQNARAAGFTHIDASCLVAALLASPRALAPGLLLREELCYQVTP